MFQRRIIFHCLVIFFLVCLLSLAHSIRPSHAWYAGNLSAAPAYSGPVFNNLVNPYAQSVSAAPLFNPILYPGTVPQSVPFRAVAGTYFINALLPADVIGVWSGTWTNSIGLITGELSLTLGQTLTDIAGTLVFSTGGVVKYGCPVTGIIDVDTLIISGTGAILAKTLVGYDITLSASVVGSDMAGTYTVTDKLLGLTLDTGNFSATRL